MNDPAAKIDLKTKHTALVLHLQELNLDCQKIC